MFGDPDYGIPKALPLLADYIGEYPWETYSLLVAPPSYPYGGIANPNLDLLSPTIIMTNDTSLTPESTLEIAHSWTGSEVTIDNWSNVWLNEGFSTFEERHVSS